MAIHYANIVKRWFSVFMGVFGAFIGGFGVYEIVHVGESRQGVIASQRPIRVVPSASRPKAAKYVVRGERQSQVAFAGEPHSGP